MEKASYEFSLERFTYEYNYLEEPNFLFLNSTLTSAMNQRSRSGVTFFSARGWRKSVKPMQIAAMRNLKKQPSEAAVKAIASDIVTCASTITNGRPYEFVCSVPGGTSHKKENFASLIGRCAACELGVRYFDPLLTAQTGRSSSHPKQSRHFRPRYRNDTAEGDFDFGLLVDDVATTGIHFERCVDLLRLNGKSVVCVSWVS